jgi:transcriptional regulator with XRE-family HTH domain
VSAPRGEDRGTVDPEQVGQDVNDEATWRPWMLELGTQIRRLRRLVGLSQQDLADLAKVSQGAVSRLETARGLATPLLIVVKINLALLGELKKFEAIVPDTDLGRARGVTDLLRAPERTLGPDAVVPDPMFSAFVRLFRETSECHREGLLAIMRAACIALRETTHHGHGPSGRGS